MDKDSESKFASFRKQFPNVEFSLPTVRMNLTTVQQFEQPSIVISQPKEPKEQQNFPFPLIYPEGFIPTPEEEKNFDLLRNGLIQFNKQRIKMEKVKFKTKSEMDYLDTRLIDSLISTNKSSQRAMEDLLGFKNKKTARAWIQVGYEHSKAEENQFIDVTDWKISEPRKIEVQNPPCFYLEEKDLWTGAVTRSTQEKYNLLWNHWNTYHITREVKENKSEIMAEPNLFLMTTMDKLYLKDFIRKATDNFNSMEKDLCRQQRKPAFLLSDEDDRFDILGFRWVKVKEESKTIIYEITKVESEVKGQVALELRIPLDITISKFFCFARTPRDRQTSVHSIATLNDGRPRMNNHEDVWKQGFIILE